MMKCKCGCENFYIEKHGNNTGLYCKSCGKWQKWLNKDEVKLYEHNKNENDSVKINGINVRYIKNLMSLKRNLDIRIDEEINEELVHQRGDSKKLVESLLYRIEENSNFFNK